MTAKNLLEKRAIFLQRFAYEVLTNPSMRLATVANVVGDPTLFDRDLSTVLSILFTHNNLKSKDTPDTQWKINAAEQPIKLLEQIFQGLQVRGFQLPNFKRRYEWIKNSTSGTFVNDKPNFEGGEANALDKPLRRLYESFYELRMHDDGHVKDNLGRQLSRNTGAELTGLVENLISSVKKLETEGQAYNVGGDESRAGKQRTEFLDKRYDDVAALINRSIGTASEGPVIGLYHLHGDVVEGEERWYIVSEQDLPALTTAVQAARPEWDLEQNTKWEFVTKLLADASYQLTVVMPDEAPLDEWKSLLSRLRIKLGPTFHAQIKDNKVILSSPRKDYVEKAADVLEKKFSAQVGLLRGERSVEQIQEEKDILMSLSQEGEDGNAVVRTIRLPFSPDQMDDAFPSAELKEDRYIGKSLSELSLELIRKSRFSGFVDFDDKYRMMILWANAPSDDQKDDEGQTFREHLLGLLKDHQKEFSSIMGQSPDVIKTKTGAAYYFARPASIPRVVKNRAALEKAIEAVNTDLSSMEQHTRIERGFNRNIEDDELPIGLEEVG